MTVLNTKSLNATSDMLVRASKGMDKRFAEHMVNIAVFINSDKANGDVSTATHFIKGLTATSGVRRQAIVNWFLAFAGCTWNQEKKAFGRKKDFTFDHELAVKNPWYAFTPDKPIVAVDAMALLKGLKSKLTNALEEGNVKNPDEAKSLLAALVAYEDSKQKSVMIEAATAEVKQAMVH